jgi:hypothetical protein
MVSAGATGTTRMSLAGQPLQRRPHSAAGGCAIIDYDDDMPFDVDRLPARQIVLAPAPDFLELPLGFLLDVAERHVDPAKGFLVQPDLWAGSLHDSP